MLPVKYSDTDPVLSRVVPEKPIVITSDQTALIKATLAADATDAELALFFYDCKRRGVHPLDKLIHFTKRQGKYTPVTSIDFFRARAAATREHMGTDDCRYTGTPGEMDFAGTVTVYRLVQGEKCPFTATARLAEYMPESPSDFMWRKMPFGQLGKCAEALALRKGFPQELEGLHTVDEMGTDVGGQPITARKTVQRASETAKAPATAGLLTTTPSRVRAVRGGEVKTGKNAGKTLYVVLLDGDRGEYSTYDAALSKELEKFIGTDHLVQIGFERNEWQGKIYLNAKSFVVTDAQPAPTASATPAEPMSADDIPFAGGSR